MASSTLTGAAAGPPTVSVIVPTYNYGRYIGETLENLRAQTYPHWECLVIDDDSSDETPDIVKRYASLDARIKYLHQENARQTAAKNRGLRNCTGQYVQFLDADDLIESRKLERHVEYLEKHPAVDIVYGGMRYFSSERPGELLYWVWGENKPWMPKVSGSGADVLTALVRANIMVINSPLVRRSVVEDVGPFDEGLPAGEDWDYWVRCAAAGKRFEYQELDGTLALVRAHASSSSRDRRRVYTAMLMIREKIKSLTGEPEVLAENQRLIAEDQEVLALEAISNSPLAECLGQMLRAGLLNRATKRRAKWLACACVAPFVPRRHLIRLVSSSLTSPWLSS